MRSYPLLLLFFSQLPHQHAEAAETIGCGLAIAEISQPGLDNLRYQSDRYLTSNCYLYSSIRPGKQRWFPALPSLSWQQGYATTLSRSELDAEFSDYQIDWPWLSLPGYSARLLLQYREQEFISEFSENTLWTKTNQLFAAGQEVSINVRSTHNGLAFEVHRAPALINRVTLKWHHQRQPLRIKQQLPAKTELLTPADLQWFTLGLEYNKALRGWSSPWQIQLGQGKVSDNGGRFMAQQDIELTFNYLQIGLAPGYLWRWSRQLQGHLTYQLDWQYLDFADARDQDRHQLTDSSSISQQLSLSLEWRF